MRKRCRRETRGWSPGEAVCHTLWGEGSLTALSIHCICEALLTSPAPKGITQVTEAVLAVLSGGVGGWEALQT